MDACTPTTPRGQFAATVVANRLICTEHYRLTLGFAAFPPSQPGQFVQLESRPGDADADVPMGESARYETAPPLELEWQPGTPRPVLHDPDFLRAQAYLRRPFSIAARRDAGSPHKLSDFAVELDIIHRVVGKGTRHLAGLAAGDRLTLLGPLGKGFRIPENLELGLLVGGGVGIPPMFYLAEALAKAKREAVGFVGAQRADLVPLSFSCAVPAPNGEGDPLPNAEEFREHGFTTVVATDDGSMGYKGFVTGALRRFLEKRPNLRRDRVTVFCCGPTPMMKATAAVAAEFGVPCQVSLEQPMACGMGTCQSCVVRYQPAGATEWTYKLTCTDGPVFDPRDLKW